MLDISRARIERLARAKAKFAREYAKVEQAQRGWFDETGNRQGGLIAFVRYFWSIIEPDRPLVDGWPVWAMCEHLEAVTFGEITRLLINVPPGFMKSLLVDVFWPAWEWGPMGKPHYRYVAFSYSATLTERDNERFRALVASERYQRLYGPFKLKSERGQDVETRKFGEDEEAAKGVTLANKTTLKVKNTRTGWKFASSVGGVGTGERGDRVILDDPHNVKESESEVVRQETVRWFRESLSSRFNDLDSGALIIIMQRVHEDDVAGTILSLGFVYCHLMIPWEYDSDRQISDGNAVSTSIGWTDPRYNEEAPYQSDGEPAWPDRFSDAAMDRTKTEVGPYAWAAQFQQAPAPRGGGIFQRAWWQLWEPPDGKFPSFEYLLASLDSAYTEKEENDPSALTIWGVFRNEHDQRRIMLVHAWRKHLQFSADRAKITQRNNESKALWKRRTQEHWGLMEWVVDTCDRFKIDKLLIEAKASGISAAQELANRFGLQSWGIQLCKVVGDKYARALAVQPTFSQQMIYAPARDWAETVIDEMAVFPKGKYKDLTDSGTQAIKHLRDIGLAQTDDEAHVAEVEVIRHRQKPKAIYPV